MLGLARGKTLGIALGGFLAVSAAACSSSANNAQSAHGGIPEGPITVAEFFSKTGADAQLGALSAKQFAAVTKLFNEQGGIDGHRVKAVVYDDKSDPATGLAQARSVAANSDVSAVMWSSSGNPTQTITLELTKEHLPVIEYEYPDYLLGSQYPTYWTNAPVSKLQAQTMASYLKSVHASNVGVLSDGTPFGSEFASAYEKSLAADNVSYKSFTYSPTSIDISTTLKKMKRAGVSVVSPVGELDVNGIFTALQQLGWNPKVVGNGVVTSYVQAVSPSLLKNTVAACQYYASAADAKTKSYKVTPLMAKLLDSAASISGRSPGNVSQLANYDAFLILKAAILKAHSTDRNAIDQAMQNLHGVKSVVPGITYSFTPSNHVGWLAKNESMCNQSSFMKPYDIPVAVPNFRD